MHFVLSIAFDKHYLCSGKSQSSAFFSSDDLDVVFISKEP